MDVTHSPVSDVGWDDDAAVAAWRGLPAMTGDRTADACVVGLGMSGLVAVEALTERGLSVVGVDAGRVAAGAAGRNGGFLVGGPAPFLHNAIDSWGPDAAVGLYRATLAELDRQQTVLGSGVVRRVGSVRLAGLPGEPVDDAEARDREAELADCVALEAALHAHDIRVQHYDGELGQGLFLPDDAATNPADRALTLASSVSGRAALYEHTPVLRVEAGRVHTAHGVVSAATVIVAVDGRLEVLLPELAGRVRTARLQMLTTNPTQPRLPCPVYGRWGYDFAQQDHAGRLFAGGGRDHFAADEWTADATPTPLVQAWIEQVARRMVDAPVTVTHRWAASVGFTDDGRPLCTEVAPGVVAIGGYSGTGNLVGPVAARAAAAYAVDGTPLPSYLAT